jgi:hypothetical protein
MRRWYLTVLATLVLGQGILAQAGEPIQTSYVEGDACAHGQTWSDKWHHFWHRTRVDWHRNNAWPEPFLSADRAAVREPFCIQADNGWKMQNTVGTFLFTDNQELNKAGELHVKWIVTQAPLHRRAVFVLRGETVEQTNARIASVNAAVGKYAGGGAIPPVIPTDSEPTGWSASYADAIAQQLQSTIPSPRLGAAESGGGSSGGSSGGQ